MSEQSPVEAFMQRVAVVPLPSSPMARMRLFAKEVAMGCLEGLWPVADFLREQNYYRYKIDRWVDSAPDEALLIQNGYFSRTSQSAPGSTGLTFNTIRIEKPAFDLIEEVEPSEIFISYRRKDSSALALLVLARLKAAGLNPFLDLSIQPGANWHAHLRDQIATRDYFVLLIGQETLASPYVQQEIQWALETDAAILPIWHNEFEYRSGVIELPPEIDRLLTSTHTIRVLEESALAYNNAIVELLNRFGVTP